VAFVACLAAAAAGLIATTSSATSLIELIVVLPIVAALLSRFGWGCFVGLLLVGGVDALPGPSLSQTHVAFTITAQDVLVGVLVGTLLVINARDRFRTMTRTSLALTICAWSVAFLVVFAAEVFRTVLTTPVPLLHAVWIVHGLAYLALLLPLMGCPLRDPAIRGPLLVTLAVGAIVANVSQALASAGVGTLSALVHVSQTGTVDGLVRLYTPASVIPTAALPIGLGLVLFAPTRAGRLTGAVLAVTGGVAVILALTRAEYVAEVVSLATAIVVWIAAGDPAARRGLGRLGAALAAVAATVGLLALVHPPQQVSHALDGVSQRALSTIDVLGNQESPTNTLAIRNQESQDLEWALGSHWLFGLGFLDSSYVYNAYVPGGSIENSDLGYLNGVMTMGVFGTVLYYVPLLLIPLALAVRRLWAPRRPAVPWVGFGVFAWAVGTIVSSKDLVILFTPTGVVAVAFILALGIVEVTGSPNRPVSLASICA